MDLGRLKIGAALVLTSPFIPMLFQGEEWGASSPFLYFTDHEDAELGQAVSQGRKREFAVFGWKPEEIPDPQARETFECSRLDWSERERPPHAELLDWHRRLIGLRGREHNEETPASVSYTAFPPCFLLSPQLPVEAAIQPFSETKLFRAHGSLTASSPLSIFSWRQPQYSSCAEKQFRLGSPKKPFKTGGIDVRQENPAF